MCQTSNIIIQNIVGIFGVLTGIAALIIAAIGGKKVMGGLLEKRVTALGTYYAKLRVYLLRFKQLLRSKIKSESQSFEANFTCALFSLSDNFVLSAIDYTDKIYPREKKQISEFANKFLQFLSTEDNQIPVINSDEDKKDDELVNKDQKNLSHLYQLSTVSSLKQVKLIRFEKTIFVCSNQEMQTN